MKRVLVFGTFDFLHPGHLHHFARAKEHGSYLIVIVARDETVMRVKGRMPEHNQEQRLQAVRSSPLVDEAHLGYADDKYRIIEDVQPDVIVLGYDQNSFVDALPEECTRRGLPVTIVRNSDALDPTRYKSSHYRSR